VVAAVVRDPLARRARAVEHRREYEDLLDGRVELDRAVRERTVVAHRGAEAPQRYEAERHQEDGPARDRVEHEAHRGERVDRDEVDEDRCLAFGDVPPGRIPGLTRDHYAFSAHCAAMIRVKGRQF
jgi:hypothetical protein